MKYDHFNFVRVSLEGHSKIIKLVVNNFFVRFEEFSDSDSSFQQI